MAQRRSPLAMVVLALLAEAPMHAYGMQQLIKERHKDDVVNVAQRNSIYQAIERLLRGELIRVAHTARDERRPERTVYEITGSGTSTLHEWLGEMLSAPAREFPEFPAALAFLPVLGVDEVRARLGVRMESLASALTAAEEGHAGAAAFLPRVFLVEDEYRIALMRAELAWIRGLIGELESGDVHWSKEALIAAFPALAETAAESTAAASHGDRVE